MSYASFSANTLLLQMIGSVLAVFDMVWGISHAELYGSVNAQSAETEEKLQKEFVVDFWGFTYMNLFSLLNRILKQSPLPSRLEF